MRISELTRTKDNAIFEGKLVERVFKGKDHDHDHVYREYINLDLLEEKFNMDLATTNCERNLLAIDNVCDEITHSLTHLNQCVTTKEANLEEVEFHSVGGLKHLNVEDNTLGQESFQQRIPLVDEVIETFEVARNTPIVQDNKEMNNNANHPCLVCKESHLQTLDTEIERARSSLNVLEDTNIDPLQLKKGDCVEDNNAMEESNSNHSINDNDEKVAASEWVVQQLAIEITKAKQNLVQKEHEEVILQDRISILERHLRDKEREIEDVELYINTIMQSNDAKQLEIDNLTFKMNDLKKGVNEWKVREIDLEMELHNLRTTLEMKEVALVELRSQAQCATKVHNNMEEAIENLEKQITKHEIGNSPREVGMDPLSYGLKSTKEKLSASQSKTKQIYHKSQDWQEDVDGAQIGNVISFYDELHAELLSTQSQLETFEQNLGMTQIENFQYKDKCKILLEAMTKMEKNVEAMEIKLRYAEAELEIQTRVVEQAKIDQVQLLQDLRSQDDAKEKLESTMVTLNHQLCDMELHQANLDDEVKRLGKTLDSARREFASKDQNTNHYRGQIEQLHEISSHSGEAQVLISNLTNELELTSTTMDEWACQLLKLQSSLIMVEDKLHVSKDAIVAKEFEREHLAKRLIVVGSELERTKEELLKVQQVLTCANSKLRLEAHNMTLHLQTLENIYLELDEWKDKSLSFIEVLTTMKNNLNCSTKIMNLEFLGSKGEAKHVQAKNVQLGIVVQHLQNELKGWKERAKIVAQNGRLVREQLENAIQCLQIEIEEWKNNAILVEKELGMEMNVDLESALQALQDKVNLGKKSNIHKAVDFFNVGSNILHEGLKRWKEKTLHTSMDIQCKKDELEHHIAYLHVELENWKSKASKVEDDDEEIIDKFTVLMKELHKDVEVQSMTIENQDACKLQLAHDVKYFHKELDTWKEKVATMVDDERYMKVTHETSLVQLQEEFCDWKEQATIAIKERKHLQNNVVSSMNGIEELQNWKHKEKMVDTTQKLATTQSEVFMEGEI